MRRIPFVGSAAILLALANFAGAQEPVDAPHLALELNRVEQLQDICRLTFVAQNQMSDDLAQTVLEAVLFDRNGMVERLSLLDLQALPQGRQRVRQFDLAGLECAQLGSVLINAVATCSGATPQSPVTPAICSQALVPSSRVENLEVLQ